MTVKEQMARPEILKKTSFKSIIQYKKLVSTFVTADTLVVCNINFIFSLPKSEIKSDLK